MRLYDYLERIGLEHSGNGALQGSIDTLLRIHAAHRETFLFENVAIQAGGAVSVALHDIERKFLDERQGGYCFEHNTLLGALRDLGFDVTTLLGRVRRGPPDRWCRTHMVLRVMIGDEPWLADVGFGALCLLEPIPLRDGARAQQVGLRYSVRREGHLWILSCTGLELGSDSEPLSGSRADSVDLYEFSEEPQTAGDVEVANHYTSTHPDSVFRRTLTIQRTTRADRTMLRHGVLTRFRDGRSEEEPVDRTQLEAVVRDVFGVELPSGPFVFETYTIAT